MLIDLFAPANFVSYNICIAETLGLEAAIYISEIANINSKAIRKDKIEDNFFTLDREYFKKRTTLSLKDQEKIEAKLLKISVLEKCATDSNKLSLNINNLLSIVNGDKIVLKDARKLVSSKKANKEAEAEAILNNLRKNIKTTNSELRAAYYAWIDSAINRYGSLSAAAVRNGQTKLDAFTGKNLDIALAVLEIGAIKGYNDMDYIINAYMTKMANTQNTLNFSPAVGPSSNIINKEQFMEGEIF